MAGNQFATANKNSRYCERSAAVVRPNSRSWGDQRRKRRAAMSRVTEIILETAVGRARVGRHGVFWQGATTLRATARKEEQRRQSAPGRLNRVRSVVTQKVNSFVSTEVSVHAALQAEVSGQLRFLG
jgi:hypothetical protein